MSIKTILATGASSGIGFQVIKQLLSSSQPYRFVLGCRDTQTAQSAFDALQYDKTKHQISVLPLDLANLKTVRSFGSSAVKELGSTRLDYLLLNAGMAQDAKGPSPHGSKWCEAYIVNHLSQHYLIHLVREKLASSNTRLVYVSSGVIRGDRDTNALSSILKAGSGAEAMQVYSASKFTQILGAYHWRRNLPSCSVIAVSPGMIPGTGLGRHMSSGIPAGLPDAKSIPEGAAAVIAAFDRKDFPEDGNSIVLASWGDWWPANVYSAAFDEKLQEAWSPSQEQIEKEEGLK